MIKQKCESYKNLLLRSCKLKERSASAKNSGAIHLPFDRPRVSDYRIHQTDYLERKALPANCCDLTVTSPLFNIGMTYDGSGEGDAIDYKENPKFTR